MISIIKIVVGIVCIVILIGWAFVEYKKKSKLWHKTALAVFTFISNMMLIGPEIVVEINQINDGGKTYNVREFKNDGALAENISEITNNNYGTITENVNVITNNNNKYDEINYLTVDKNSILEVAHEEILAGNYERAFELYQYESVLEDETAKTNRAYMYSKGIFVEQNIGRAIELYQETNSIHAKRALVAAYLKNGDFENCKKMIDELLQQRDEILLDYLSCCLFNVTFFDLSSELQNQILEGEFPIENLYSWGATSYFYSGVCFPNANLDERWMFIGYDSIVNSETNKAVPIWRKYELINIEMLEYFI